MGKPSARVGDNHTCPAVTSKTPHVGGPISTGSGNVFSGKQPAGRVDDNLVCDGPKDTIVKGSSSVFINGRPAARMTDPTAHGGVIVEGLDSVFIGDTVPSDSGEGVADQVPPCSPSTDNPVNPILGSKLLPATTDFALPAPAAFVFSRGYVSSNANIGIFGQGWSATGSNLRLTLEPQEAPEPDETPASNTLTNSDKCDTRQTTEDPNQVPLQLILHDSHGRKIRFSELGPGAIAYSETEQFWLARGGAQNLTGQHASESSQLHPSQHHAFSGIPETKTLDEDLYLVSTGQRVYLLSPSPIGWQLAAEYTQHGYCTRYERDAAGFIQRVIDSAGRHYFFKYQVANSQQPDDPGMRLSAIELEGELSATLVQYEYNATGDLIAVRDRSNQLVIEYQWQRHILVGYRQPGLRTMRYEWSELSPRGKVLREIKDNGLTREFDYQTGFTRVTDNLGRQEDYLFTGTGPDLRWIGHRRADSSEIHFSHNGQGQRLSEIDPLGNVTSYQHDTHGNLTALTQPGNQTFRYQRNTQGQVTQVSSPDGGTRVFDYDAQGNMIKSINELQHVSRIKYEQPDLPDRPTKRIDPEGATYQYTWTRHGQLASVTDCSGHITRYEYDNWGHLIRVTDALGQITEYAYSTQGQRTSALLPDGSRAQYRYNEQGFLIQARDAQGVIQTLSYNEHGLPIAETDANGHTRLYQYDVAGRLTQITNANGAVYTFEYDKLDRVIREVGFDGREREYVYNLRGDLIEQHEYVNGVRQTINMHYDQMGRVVARALPATGTTPAQVEHFRYDSMGRMLEADNIYARVSWTYDARGASISEKQWHKNPEQALQAAESDPQEIDQVLPSLNPDSLMWSWYNRSEFNAQGVPSLTQHGEHQMTWLTYGSGHLLALRMGTFELSLEPDELHREQKRQINSTNQTQPLLNREKRFSPVGLLSAQRDIYLGGTQQLADQSPPIEIQQYRYDARYRLASIDQMTPSNTGDQALTILSSLGYEYDPAGRLIASQHSHSGQISRQEYALDSEGNRIDFGHKKTQWKDNRVSHYRRVKNHFDDAGNLIERISDTDTQRYFYDALHRLSCVERRQIGQPTLRVYYIYDALSRRIAKQVIPERSPAYLTRYGWDGDQLVHENNGEKQITHFYEPGSFVPLFRIDESSVSSQQAQENPQEPTEELAINTKRHSVFITDHLGTPTKLIDEDGNLVWSAQPDDCAAVQNELMIPKLSRPFAFKDNGSMKRLGFITTAIDTMTQNKGVT
ncbi:PAAR domain-containing protein [Idiomarina abyssalis]|uniref:PAAR domain-containing protein n=1 Tax=Idiomarina abyssalis TaxID=86102 RepID=UPI003A8E89E2